MSISFSKEMIFTCSTHKIWSKSTGTYFQRVHNLQHEMGGGGVLKSWGTFLQGKIQNKQYQFLGQIVDQFLA